MHSVATLLTSIRSLLTDPNPSAFCVVVVCVACVAAALFVFVCVCSPGRAAVLCGRERARKPNITTNPNPSSRPAPFTNKQTTKHQNNRRPARRQHRAAVPHRPRLARQDGGRVDQALRDELEEGEIVVIEQPPFSDDGLDGRAAARGCPPSLGQTYYL